MPDVAHSLDGSVNDSVDGSATDVDVQIVEGVSTSSQVPAQDSWGNPKRPGTRLNVTGKQSIASSGAALGTRKGVS